MAIILKTRWAGGLPMMLFGSEPGANIDGAPVLNGITLIAKAAEMAITVGRWRSSNDNHFEP